MNEPTTTDDETTTEEQDERPGAGNVLNAVPPPLPEDVTEARSWLAWLREECPVDSITFGGVTFHKRVDVQTGDGKTWPQPGQILDITAAQIKLIEEDLQTRVLRSYFEIDPKTGRKVRRGQQDIGLYRWDRPGMGPDGGPLLGPDKKTPIEKPTLVRTLNAKTSPNDEPWSKYVVLEPATPEIRRKFYERMGRKKAVDVVKEARAWNEAKAQDERSLAEEAGISPRHAAVMTRID